MPVSKVRDGFGWTDAHFVFVNVDPWEGPPLRQPTPRKDAPEWWRAMDGQDPPLKRQRALTR